MTTTKTRMTRMGKVWLIIGVALMVWCAVSLIATKLIYDGIFVRYEDHTVAVPDALTQMVDERTTVVYPAGDHKLTGYVYRPQQEEKDALIVLAPGFHACADDYYWQISELLDYGWAVFAFDPTGSCHSEGDSCVGFPQELVDLKATLAFIREESHLEYEKLVLLGHSRGGYAACCAADEDGVAAVISVSGINSAMEGIMGSTVNAIGPIAYGNYPFLWLYQTMLFGGEVANADASQVLSDSDVPTLLVHGQADEQVPLDKYSVVSHVDEIDNPSVKLMLCADAGKNGHTNLLFDEDGTANDALMAQIHRFLEENI